MDHENYWFSSRTAGNSDIQRGVEDLKAALALIEQVTGKASALMFGESSGAIRAGAFAIVEPNRVERLVLHVFTYTGENAPEIRRNSTRPIAVGRSASQRYNAFLTVTSLAKPIPL
jgi:hypothetical protein